MSRYQSKSGGGLGVALGFLAGVGVGLLFATRTGSQARERIAALVRKGRARGKGLAEAAGEELETAKETMTSEGGKEPFYESGKYT